MLKLIKILISLSFIVLWSSSSWSASMRDVDTLLRAESYSEAKKMLEIMAKDGDPEAYYMLGVLYDEGLGVPENVKQAIKFYEKAAIAGYIYAMTDLASLFTEDPRVDEDHLKAYSLFLKAATLGDAKALSALSSMHHIGYIFPPYKSDAIRFALLAQNNGWDYDNDYFNYTVVNEVSKKKLKKLMEKVKSCSKPFDQRCKISEPLELTVVYLRKSDIKFMKYKKGYFLMVAESSHWKKCLIIILGCPYHFP